MSRTKSYLAQVKSQGGRFLEKSVDGSWSIPGDSATINMVSRSILCSIIRTENFEVDALKKQNIMLKRVAQENKKLHANMKEITTLKQKLSAEEALSRKRAMLQAKHESEQEEYIATLEQQLIANKALVKEQAKHVTSLKKLNDTLEDKLNQEESIIKEHTDYECGQNGRIAFLESEIDYYRTAYSCEYFRNEQYNEQYYHNELARRERDTMNNRYWQSVGAPVQGAAGVLVCRLGSKEQPNEGESGGNSTSNDSQK